MANPVDSLIIEIKAETATLRKELDKVKKKLKETEEKSKGVNDAMKTLGQAIAALGLGILAANVVQTIREFEDLEATLRAVTGSSEGAAASMKLIREFTKGTTFQIQEVTGAFIRLKLAGVVPTSGVMRDFGNLAAGMGRSIEDLALAAFNATTGEMEMLKQFGIRAVQEGDKITVTFDGVTKEIERSGEAVINYLREIGRETFPNALDERLNTLSGAISNAKDAASEFAVSIGEGGVTDVLTQFNKDIADALNSSRDFAESLGSGLAVVLTAVLTPLKLVVENLKAFVAITAGATIMAIIANFAGLVKLFNQLKKAIAGAAAAVAGFLGIASGGTALPLIAAGVATAAGVYAALGGFAEDAAVELDGLASADEDVNKTVTATVDKIGKLNKKYKEFTDLLKKEIPKGAKDIFEFGAEDAAAELDKMFREFQKATSEDLYDEHPMVKMMRDMGQENPVMPVSIDPTIEGNENLFRDEFLKSLGMTEEQISQVLGANVVGPVKDSIKEIKDVLGQEEDDLLTKLLGDEAALRNVYELAGGAEALGVSFEELKQKMKDTKAVAEAEFSEVGNLIMDAFNESAPEDLAILAEVTKEQVKEAFTTAKLLGEIAEDLDFETFFERYTAGLKMMGEAAADARTPLQQLNDTIDELHGKEESRQKVLDSLNAAVAEGVLTQDQANQAYREYLETLGPSDQAMARIADRIESMAMTFSDDLVNAIKEGESALDVFESFAENIVTAVIQEFMRLMVIKPIVDAILGHFDIASTSGGGTGDNNASGGRAHRGVPTLVGERGPEIFVPQSHGTVMNGMNTKSALAGGGGPTIVQNINFATGVQATVRQEVLGLMPRIADAAKMAVSEQAQRGGTYRRSLQGG